MATAPPTATPIPTPPPPPPPQKPESVTVYQHSALFYWWPVWAVGFLMGILTLIDGHFLVVMPAGTKGVQLNKDEAIAKSYSVAFPKDSPIIKLPDHGTIPREDGGSEPSNGRTAVLLPKETFGKPEAEFNRLHMARSSGYGVIFATVLLLVIFITNVPLRGMWSVIVIVTIVLVSIIFALAHWWDIILEYAFALDIRINAGGYFFISGILFGIWIITMLVFDRQIYMEFSPGQLKVCTEIGGGVRDFDTAGLKLEKQRSDLFRHWVLGLGSGDLIVHTSGAASERFELDNVLFIGQTAARIERLIRMKAVEAT